MQSADREEALFAAALEKPTPAERAAYLDGVCGGDLALRARIEALLAAHEAAGGVLDAPPDSLTSTGGYRPLTEGPGTVIGRYKLLQQIGEGGMGVVYMAEQQEPVRRKVALKIIKPGMDRRQVIARFEAERQALALMDHQNIAKVLDAGTIQCGPLAPREVGPPLAPREDHTGRPYFVMELVHGVKITKFCDDNKLTPRERLQLFIPVCQAIQHAHQKGIIHRDIKPSNVLVTMYDDKPVPKVIDFGVAKAIEQRLTEKTMFTQFGALVGTYEYMSPEQAEMNAFGVDTRSDVYSLGVLVYELLTGTTPLEHRRLREAALAELVRLIKEEEAVPPSKRLSSSNNLPKIAAARRTEPARLSKLVRGEIDWIVMKCLEKDRSRRYDTASGLARDVERYLADEPVEACPPSARYLLSKFARKHRKALATTAAFAVLLVAATVLSACLALWAVSAEKEADQRRIDAEGAKQQALAAKAEADRRREEARFNQYVAHMHLVQREYEANNIDHVHALLEALIPREPGLNDYRGFEWYYWQRMSHRELLTLKGHTGPITGVMFSRNGRRLVSWGQDSTVRVWDAASGRQLSSRGDQATGVCAVALSPDGRRVASWGKDHRGGVWDAASGRDLFVLQEPGAGPSCVAFSPDGRRLAWRGGDKVARVCDAFTGRVLLTLEGYTGTWPIVISPDGRRLASADSGRVWDAATGRELFSLKPHRISPRGVAFSPDGRRLASWGALPIVQIYDATTGRVLFATNGPPGSIADDVVFSPDGQRLALLAGESAVPLWDAATGEELLALEGHTAEVRGIEFSPDGRRVATASTDRTVRVWDAANGHELFTLKGHTGAVVGVTFSPDGRHLASWGDDSTVRLWDAATGQDLLTVGGGGIFSPDGQRLIGPGRQDVPVWDVRTGRVLFTLKGHTRSGIRVACSPDGRRLASAGWDSTVRVWDAGTGEEQLTLRGHRGWIYAVAFGPESRLVASAGEDRTVRVWDAANGQVLQTLKGHTGPVLHVTFSPDGRQLASCGQDALVRVWDLASGQELRALITLKDHRGIVDGVAFSADGRRLAASGRDGTGADWDRTARVWDTRTGQELMTFRGHERGTLGVVFSPDGQRLASWGQDSVGRVWDGRTGRQLLRLQGHTGEVLDMAFSPDGRRLASAGKDSTVRIWDADTGQELLTLRVSGVRGVVFSPDSWRLKSWGGHGGVQIWEADAVPGDAWRKRGLARDVQALFSQLFLREFVVAALRSERTLSEPDRAFALEVARTHYVDENAEDWNEEAWHILRKGQRGQRLGEGRASKRALALGLRLATATVRLAPGNANVLTTLGFAQYCTGEYAEALSTLTKAEKLGAKREGSGPVTLGILAMTQHRLGKKDEARATLARLRETMKQPRWAADTEAQDFLREAEALLAKPSTPDAK